MIPGSANPLLLASAAQAGGYAIDRSLRFNSADSAYLSRTPASAGNRKTWTWAGWLKFSAVTGAYGIFEAPFQSGGAGVLSDVFEIWYNAGQLNLTDYVTYYFTSAAKLRDPSAWQHFVFTCDTTQATASNRFKVYQNGAQLVNIAAGTITQNLDTAVNNAVPHEIGRSRGTSANDYLADVHFIDGQALDPTSFGEFDTNGIWQPKAYTGTYGTNGFHLTFSDNSTAGSLGDDSSGNGNDWTVNNLSIGIAGNTSQNWSATASIAGQFGFEATKAFDGDALSSSSTYYFPGTDGTGTFTFAQSIPYSTIKIWYGRNNGRLFVNGVDMVVGSTSYAELTQADLAAKGVSSPLVSIGLERTGAGNGAYLFGVEVNGSQLVDPAYSAVSDSLVDVPTNGTETDTGLGGEVRGNYCTWDPLNFISNYAHPENGNLQAVFDVAAGCTIAGNFYVSSGKWYWEVVMTVKPAGYYPIVGVVKSGYDFSATAGSSYLEASPLGYVYGADGHKGNNGSTSAYGASFAQGDILGFALDLDAGTITAYKNGVSQGVMYSGLSGSFAPAVSSYSIGGTNRYDINCGQRPFAYTAPSGFKSLCTANLPAPVITKPSKHMDVVTYTGNGSTQTISGLEFSPDLVWIKNRAQADNHKLLDTVRGATEELESNTTDAEVTNADGLTAFNSDGFDLGADAEYNTNTEAYVAWNWDAGDSTVTNTDGSITSQVRANPSAGFSIVTYTGTGSASTIGHGLNVAPALMLVKTRSSVFDWAVYHVSLGGTQYLDLNTTDAAVTADGRWNDTNPTSSVFSVAGSGSTNKAGDNYVAYCFAPVESYSAFGSYTGNGSADGPFVFTNMRPRWILIKRTDTTGNWTIIDTAREGYNVDNDPLFPNTSGAETTTDLADILSNGFKLRSTDVSANASAGTYIYAAFAESPFQYARAR